MFQNFKPNLYRVKEREDREIKRKRNREIERKRNRE
jgi:hypothetical protein